MFGSIDNKKTRLLKFQNMYTLTPAGWDKQSYGYHGDDGNSFCSSGQGEPYGPTFSTGDVIGCCVNLIENTCFYTKNGVNLGKWVHLIHDSSTPTWWKYLWPQYPLMLWFFNKYPFKLQPFVFKTLKGLLCGSLALLSLIGKCLTLILLKDVFDVVCLS